MRIEETFCGRKGGRKKEGMIAVVRLEDDDQEGGKPERECMGCDIFLFFSSSSSCKIMFGPCK